MSRNQHAELIAEQKFSSLQAEFLESFGARSPSAPVLRCRNATQTSVVLEWDPIDLATAELRSLSLYRNGTKAGVIPRDKVTTKISGLALDETYTFQLVLRTSAGQYSSEKLSVKTHKMTDLGGITITPGVMPRQLRDSLASTVQRIGAKMIDTVRIDTTHFVCTEPRGQAWEKAVDLNVPVVVPDWVMGCEREGRIVGVRGYYLDADPKLRTMGPASVNTQQQQRQSPSSSQRPSVTSVPIRESPRIEHTPPTPVERSGSSDGLPDGPIRNNQASANPAATPDDTNNGSRQRQQEQQQQQQQQQQHRQVTQSNNDGSNETITETPIQTSPDISRRPVISDRSISVTTTATEGDETNFDEVAL